MGMKTYKQASPRSQAAMNRLLSMFPNASADTVAANPHLSCANGAPAIKNTVQGNVDVRNVRRGRLNKTESEFAMILEAMKRKGEILRYEFEGITLRFAGVKYTPDFVVFDWIKETNNYKELRLIEVKGPFIKGNRERAVERFRHAKTYWPEFTFEMHQKTKNGWRKIL